MAKKWGGRGKKRGAPEVDPRAMFGAPQAPRSAPPASSTPLADHLGRGWPGVDADYVVLPRSLAEQMPLPWQQQMRALLGQFHETHARLTWPAYRVVPSRPERLMDLDEEQLAEAGFLVEIDAEGEMVYRERSGRKVDDPSEVTVLVSCLDPIGRRSEQVQEQAPVAGRSGPVPMNIGPQPVWTPTSRPGSSAPPLPPQSTASSVTSPGPTASSAPGQPVVPSPAPPSEPRATQSASAPPASPPVAEPAAREPRQDPEPATPPRGVSLERGWFDEMPGESTAQSNEPAEPSFGPTGDEPTQIPYRYRQ